MTQANESQGAMKVRKYFAADMRSALEMVRAQQGPDVLILSNRQLDDGIELITADDTVDKKVVESLRTQSNKKTSEGVDGKSPAPSVRQVNKRRGDGLRGKKISRDTEQSSAGLNFSGDSFASRRSAKEKHSPPASYENLLWTDEDTVDKMRLEMQQIKVLLEQQLSGLAWSDYGHRYPQRARLLRTLSRIGIAPELAKRLVEQVPVELDLNKAWRFVVKLLSKSLRVLSDPIIAHGGTVAICGPTGVGKTTLVCKLAARYAQRHGTENVTIISLDDQRLGAHQQLKVFARLSGIECVLPGNAGELEATLRQHRDLATPHLSLIDTSGFAPDDIRFRESMARLRVADIYFTISATTDYPSLNKVVSLGAEVGAVGCMLTKVDEAAQLGGVLSALVKAKIPLAYVSTGQAVPDDLETADAKRLVAQALAMAELEGMPANDLSIEHTFAQKSQD